MRLLDTEIFVYFEWKMQILDISLSFFFLFFSVEKSAYMQYSNMAYYFLYLGGHPKRNSGCSKNKNRIDTLIPI